MSRFAFRTEDHPLVQSARRADEEASDWHQGSGTHTGTALAATEHHLDQFRETGHPGHYVAAKLWSDAARAEATNLRKTSGDWVGYRSWLKSPSGKATKTAEMASRKVQVNPKDFY